MKKTIWLAAALGLILGGCAEMETKPAAPAKPAAVVSPELDKAIADAEKEIAAAKKANNLWTKTEGFLEDAKKARAEGKGDEAMKKAKKALKEAQLAQKQAAAEANAKPYYPK
jgi:hypothetical protein